MRVQIFTDAWHPQVNGVVRTLTMMGSELSAMGHEVNFVTPADFRTIPCPTYPEIRLALGAGRAVAARIETFRPEAIHIATEGPIGFAARRYCVKRKIPFSTAFHTRFPEYIHARIRFPVRWSYAMVRWFHKPAMRVMVPTESVRADLEARGFTNLAMWTRGVDLELFHPRPKSFLKNKRPILLYVGRVAVEKSIGDFLDLQVEGSKVVVGDGPDLEKKRARYPQVDFVGVKHGEELAAYYAAADVFVFPSRTDTFGNVMLESLASGVPVAAYPVIGPRDVINGYPVGCLNEDLNVAVRSALQISPQACRAFAEERSWQVSAEQFLANLAPFGPLKYAN
jgi:glycosyltransferase involved in cell wall biosynthesis